MAPHPSQDRRVRRTKTMLHSALGSLLHEKAWDDIAVKQILGRADVGRSTFYAHFRDKDALLVSALREILHLGGNTGTDSVDPVEYVLRFSLPLLEHIQRLRSNTEAAERKHYSALHRHLGPALVDVIAAELRRVMPSPVLGSSSALPLDLVGRQIASTFILTLDWWIGLPEPRPANDADEVFRRLARPVLEASLAR